jgi:hypothetical protein
MEQWEEGQTEVQRVRLEQSQQSQNEGKNNKLLPQLNELQKKVNENETELQGLRQQVASLL